MMNLSFFSHRLFVNRIQDIPYMNLGGPEGKVILNDDFVKKSLSWPATIFHPFFENKM